jgi:methylglutaconyl-CoA hydratase
MLVTSSTSARGVVTIALNRPEKHNALDGETLKALHGALRAVDADPRARAVVLTGNGPSFCAGADIAHMRSMLGASEETNIADARLLADCLRALDELRVPVIARVNGNVFGGGLGLIACADIAVSVTTAKFALTEVRLGIVPAAISPYVVAAIGARQARRLFLTGAPFEAAEARELELVHFVCDASDLDSTVERQVELVLQGGPAALSAAKKLVRDVSQATDRTELAERTARLLAALRTSPEGQEGLSAFLERRKPAWTREPPAG